MNLLEEIQKDAVSLQAIPDYKEIEKELYAFFTNKKFEDLLRDEIPEDLFDSYTRGYVYANNDSIMHKCYKASRDIERLFSVLHPIKSKRRMFV